MGASGYVGSRLVPELLGRGHDVVATYRGTRRAAYPWVRDVEWRRADVLDEAQVVAAVEGADAVCYLVHGLGEDDFMTRDRQAADNVRHAVGVGGVGRLVYLSGIVPDGPREELSDHLLSRLEVEEILSSAESSVLTLRASMVIGAGSTSFEVMRQLSERLPVVQTVPAWMATTLIQPVAVADAVHFLAEALERPDVTGHLDVVGPDRVTYAELLRAYAAESGLVRIQVPVWLAPVDAVTRVVGAVVDVPAALVGSLIPSLGHDMVAGRDAAGELGAAESGPLPVAEAIRRSLGRARAGGAGARWAGTHGPAEGALVDGAVIDGAVIDGAVVDGVVVDGVFIDGVLIDGAMGDGSALDGAAIGGDPMAPSVGDPPWSRHRTLYQRLRDSAGLP
ncbi:NAD(P)H-binding protein [Intrasporangium oryzae]|uniref:NAD(P)H-binding protein n=1 Tax=Intrasporangium oryzae TaxID=412687 RepID=UPI0004B80C09|nr:NAD(P)H-binding protein [Intrasporangium oryzae]